MHLCQILFVIDFGNFVFYLMLKKKSCQNEISSQIIFFVENFRFTDVTLIYSFRMGCLQSSDGKKDKGTSENIGSEAPKKVDPRLPFETYRQLFNLKNSWKAVSRKLDDTAKDNLLRYSLIFLSPLTLM